MSNHKPQISLASRERIDQAMELLKELEEIDTAALGKRIETTITGIERRRRRQMLLRGIAAAAILLLGMGGILMNLDHKPEEMAIARINDNIVLSLSDGSNITINGNAKDTLVTKFDDVAVRMESGKLVYSSNNGDPQRANVVVYSKLAVPCGSRFDIVLSDGTHVWLNSDSYLYFPSVFNGDERRVTLSGEAYFEVNADAEKPFVIETHAQTLTVLGTEFNVNAYPEDKAVYTTLISGKVSLRSLKTNAEIKLSPDQQAVLDASGDFILKPVNSAEFTEWRNGLFVFEGNTMEQIMQKLARWYDIGYSFKDEAAKSLVTKGCIPVQDDINTILAILENTGPLKFKTSGNHIDISMKR